MSDLKENLAILSDQAVQSTTDEAAISKMSAVLKGYYRDDYLPYFIKGPASRSPLINRGYFTRVTGIRRVIDTFFECNSEAKRVQIVNLGAGLDTTYFYIRNQQKNRDFTYIEVDFPENSFRKGQTIMRHEELWQTITSNKEELFFHNGFELRGPNFALVGADMRELDALSAKLLEVGLRKDTPTLFISECVFVYMPPREADKVIEWAAAFIDAAPIAFVMYEQVNPYDAFGKQMIANLASRGCALLALPTYPSIGAQRARFTSLGWAAFAGGDMNEIYDFHLGASELARVQRLELFDELEEWRLIQGHYFIGVAVRGSVALPVAADADAPAAAAKVVDLIKNHPLYPAVVDLLADPMGDLQTAEERESLRLSLGAHAPLATIYTPQSRQAPLTSIRYSIPPGVHPLHPMGVIAPMQGGSSPQRTGGSPQHGPLSARVPHTPRSRSGSVVSLNLPARPVLQDAADIDGVDVFMNRPAVKPFPQPLNPHLAETGSLRNIHQEHVRSVSKD